MDHSVPYAKNPQLEVGSVRYEDCPAATSAVIFQPGMFKALGVIEDMTSKRIRNGVERNFLSFVAHQ